MSNYLHAFARHKTAAPTVTPANSQDQVVETLLTLESQIKDCVDIEITMAQETLQSSPPSVA